MVLVLDAPTASQVVQGSGFLRELPLQFGAEGALPLAPSEHVSCGFGIAVPGGEVISR